MLKNRIALSAICFALLASIVVLANLCAASAARGVAVTNGDSLSSLPRAVQLQSPPETVRVRLTQVETNADLVDWPVPGSKITIKVGETIFNKETNDDGVAVFDAVPCGQQVVITVKDEYRDEGVFRRRLACARRQVDLGILDTTSGGKYRLQQRKLQSMAYDPTRNVWRDANGKIVSMRTFNRIMSRRK